MLCSERALDEKMSSGFELGHRVQLDDPQGWINSTLPLVDLREFDPTTNLNSTAVNSPPSPVTQPLETGCQHQDRLKLSSTERHTVVQLPFSQIDKLSMMLPPRNVPFAALIDPETQDIDRVSLKLALSIPIPAPKPA